MIPPMSGKRTMTRPPTLCGAWRNCCAVQHLSSNYRKKTNHDKLR